ncbi:MAG: T9SS type A sorting domain-containing protein [Chitinophagaceae bacterium]
MTMVAPQNPASDDCQGYQGSAGTGNVSYVLQGGINCTGNFSSYGAFSNDVRPNIQFTYVEPGTQVQTTLNTSRTEYLGPNADLYFYDQSTSQLLARIKNTSSFDYGCTQVFIDRSNASAGTNSVAFWNNTPANYLLSKTIKVVPTTNNTSGTYQISLYYTQSEINNWQTATGQNVSNIELVKVASQISDVTPANPSGGGTVIKVAPTVTTLGTNTVITGSFTNGFSGFGAGITGNSALPVTLLDFSGTLRSAAAVLNWSTSSEINSSYFDIERSYDGVSFVKVGAITAAGISSSIKNYSFTNQSLQEHNYYRLKQVDIDGHFVYSKTILVDYQQYNGNFRIINNPFTDVLEIDFGKVQSGKTAIRLLDVTGKEIYHAASDATGQSRIRINLSGRNISAGIYLLQVTSNKQEYIERVMKR